MFALQGEQETLIRGLLTKYILQPVETCCFFNTKLKKWKPAFTICNVQVYNASGSLSHPFLGEGSPTTIDYYRKKGPTYSNLSGGPMEPDVRRVLATMSLSNAPFPVRFQVKRGAVWRETTRKTPPFWPFGTRLVFASIPGMLTARGVSTKHELRSGTTFWLLLLVLLQRRLVNGPEYTGRFPYISPLVFNHHEFAQCKRSLLSVRWCMKEAICDSSLLKRPRPGIQELTVLLQS